MRIWWLLSAWARHPLDSFRWSWKAWHVPVPGDLVTDCRGLTLAVASVDGDDLVLADGTRASWMHCCSYAERP